jgi:hypothetical protein
MRAIAVIVLIITSSTLHAATLDKTLPCGRAGEAGGLAAGTDLQRITIDTRRYPDAVCNDATPGVFYVGRYTREEDRDKWLIFLQGGGGCGGGQECAERWCSSETNFGMDKMSSSLAKPSVNGTGIFDRRGTNRFSGWNHVLLYYCSSDNWSGNKLNKLSASNASTQVEFDIHFRGSRIVAAVVDTLRKTAAGKVRAVRPATGPASDLPDLDEATDVLFAGSSAGGGGVRNNADRVGATLRANNPGVRYRAAIDASFGPESEDLDFTRSNLCASDPALCSYAGVFTARYESTVVATWGGQLDDTCVAWHRANAPGSEWRCADGEHVSANHISTELFARQDLQDGLLTGNFVEAGLGSALDFGRLQEADLREMPTLAARAEEGPAAAGGKNVAVFGPQCTDHESLTSNRAFFNVTVMDGGIAHSFHDVLWDWWSGGAPVVIRPFTGRAGAAPECP